MKCKTAKILFLCFAGIAVLLSGCAVENEMIAKMPLFSAKSDRIPGLDSPRNRTLLIREKGEKGAKADVSTREILTAQLMYEYQTSPDPNMRREAVDAMAKIPHTQRDKYLREILQDENPFVRMSALEALGKTYSGSKEDLTAILIDRMKADPDKDVRVCAVRILGDVCETPKSKVTTVAQQDRQSVVIELGNLLYDRVPAVQYEAMQSLQKITKQDYGNDVNRWIKYVSYTKGEIPEPPQKRTLAEKMPQIALPMFK